MNKKVSVFFLIAVALTGCTSTLQEDIFVSSDASEEILNAVSDYENTFIKYDADFILNQKITLSSSSELHASIDAKIAQSHEPAVIAHLQAMNGLLYLMENKTAKAQNYLKDAKAAQASDAYVLLLQSRLLKTNEEKLAFVEEILEADKSNKILILEKGKLLFQMKQYDKSIAAIDSALMIFDDENKPEYRECYSSFREQVWKLYSAKIDENTVVSVANIDLNANLTKEGMIILTKDNSTLLNDFTTGTKTNTNELIKKVTAYGLLSSTVDSKNADNSAAKILNANAITRIMAARFIWNLFVEKKGNDSLKTRYSSRYQKMQNATSPIEDVDIFDEDFDAVLGTVERELMDLPDGKNFYPDEIITGIDFLGILKKTE